MTVGALTYRATVGVPERSRHEEQAGFGRTKPKGGAGSRQTRQNKASVLPVVCATPASFHRWRGTGSLTTIINNVYTVDFWLSDNGGLTTFSSLSTNGDINDTGGNGADLLVYGGAIPTATPLPAALPLFAGGLGWMGLFGRARKRKKAAATAAA
jgi:hypothetical protein